MYTHQEVTTARNNYLAAYPFTDHTLNLFLRIFEQISPLSLFIQELTKLLVQKYPPNILVALLIFEITPGEWNDFASHILIHYTVFTS